MGKAIKWSFSADKCFRRCQRQFGLQYLAAWHTTNDPLRKEAFLLKQIKTADLWHGSLVHRGIELYLIPALQNRQSVDWPLLIQQTSEIAKRQFAFSAARRYRESQMTKTKAGDDYCALLLHEGDSCNDDSALRDALDVIACSFSNLSEMPELLQEMSGRQRYWQELEVRVTYDAAAIVAYIDLLFFREFGKPTIVDWKVSESIGGGDADIQTALYAWALCQHSSWRVENAEDCELLEVQLLSKTVLRHRCTQDTFDRLEDRIYRSVNRIKALYAEDAFDVSLLDRFDFAANPNSCAFCSMRPLCQKLAAETDGEVIAAPRQGSGRKKGHAHTHRQLF